MVVKRFGLLFCVVLSASCSDGNSPKIPVSDILITPLYKNEVPIVSILNTEILTEKEKLFKIDRPTKLQVFALGEMDINLADVPRQYLFKSDDIELFFEDNNKRLKSYIFSWPEKREKDNSTEYLTDSVKYNSEYDTKIGEYRSLISIPWTVLDIKPKQDLSFYFDIAVGDNDDGTKQHSKVGWNSNTDLLTKAIGNLGQIKLSTDKKSSDRIIHSVYRNIKEQLRSENWLDIPEYPLSKVLLGDIKNKDDLFARVQSCWDKDKLYLYVRVLDSRKGFAFFNNIKAAANFFDYGLIEDSRGETIWRMNAFYSRHAGGAIKNQFIDTVLNLQKGTYKLKYITDESHSWNNWDDKPPNSTFYGILLFNYKTPQIK